METCTNENGDSRRFERVQLCIFETLRSEFEHYTSRSVERGKKSEAKTNPVVCGNCILTSDHILSHTSSSFGYEWKPY